MENLTHALYMAFAVFVFIIAFSVTLYMIGKLNNTTKTLVYRIDKTNYFDSLVLNDVIKNNGDDSVDNRTAKIVGVDSIIPTLYRYYKESFAVKIVAKNGDLLQYFDLNTESKVRNIDRTVIYNLPDKEKNEQKALTDLYGSGKTADLFGAPWMGSIENEKLRVDMYINGLSGYIDTTFVNYTNNNLNMYRGRKFKEVFSQYAYEGDTITESTLDENGDVTDELITLTGSKQISTKIVITYQLLD